MRVVLALALFPVSPGSSSGTAAAPRLFQNVASRHKLKWRWLLFSALLHCAAAASIFSLRAYLFPSGRTEWLRQVYGSQTVSLLRPEKLYAPPDAAPGTARP